MRRIEECLWKSSKYTGQRSFSVLKFEAFFEIRDIYFHDSNGRKKISLKIFNVKRENIEIIIPFSTYSDMKKFENNF